MKLKRRYKSTGGVGTIKEYVGYSEDHHWYMVTMIPHNKGNARRVQERSISRCFSGYSSFDDVLNADERRKRRRLEGKVVTGRNPRRYFADGGNYRDW